MTNIHIQTDTHTEMHI